MAKFSFTKISPKEALNPFRRFDFNATDILLKRIKGALITFPPRVFEAEDKNFEDFSYEVDEAEKQSLLNTPVYDTLSFGYISELEKNNYFDIEGNELSYNPVQIDVAIVTVSQTKNTVTTAIQGKNGTVKEYISDGDYIINIQGILWNKTKTYPVDQVQKLITICKIPGSIRVFSDFAEYFSIHDIVITDYNFPQIEGVRNQQTFTINALSDYPINLEQIDS